MIPNLCCTALPTAAPAGVAASPAARAATSPIATRTCVRRIFVGFEGVPESTLVISSIDTGGSSIRDSRATRESLADGSSHSVVFIACLQICPQAVQRPAQGLFDRHRGG